MAEAAAATTETGPSLDWIREFGERWIGAWNSHDLDGVLALMNEDVEYEDDAWHKTMHGHDDVREYISTIWRASPDMRYEWQAEPYVIQGQPKAAFVWRAWGTQTGPLDPPGLAPTDRSWVLNGVDLHEYRDERLSRIRVIVDMMAASRQLGLMPERGSRGEQVLAAMQRSGSRVRRRFQRRPAA